MKNETLNRLNTLFPGGASINNQGEIEVVTYTPILVDLPKPSLTYVNSQQTLNDLIQLRLREDGSFEYVHCIPILPY